jgi:hypothetical protein
MKSVSRWFHYTDNAEELSCKHCPVKMQNCSMLSVQVSVFFNLSGMQIVSYLPRVMLSYFCLFGFTIFVQIMSSTARLSEKEMENKKCVF